MGPMPNSGMHFAFCKFACVVIPLSRYLSRYRVRGLDDALKTLPFASSHGPIAFALPLPVLDFPIHSVLSLRMPHCVFCD